MSASDTCLSKVALVFNYDLTEVASICFSDSRVFALSVHLIKFCIIFLQCVVYKGIKVVLAFIDV